MKARQNESAGLFSYGTVKDLALAICNGYTATASRSSKEFHLRPLRCFQPFL